VLAASVCAIATASAAVALDVAVIAVRRFVISAGRILA
jgi:hypothetical protein